MNLRMISAGIFLLAGYLAFGDFLTASTLSAPEAFVSDVGRGIGSAVSEFAYRVELFFAK